MPNRKCGLCKGRGWVFAYNANRLPGSRRPRHEIQKCDSCAKYSSDAVAKRAARRQGFMVRRGRLVTVPKQKS